MALVFPRDMTTGLRWRAPRLMLNYRQELSRDAGGRAQGRDLGPALWSAEFRSVPLPLFDADAAIARLRTLGGALRTFYLTSPTRRAPASLADAAALDGAAVTVASIRGDNAALSLAGLPVGLELRAGDYLSIQTSAQGRDFHQIASDGAADALGVTPELEIVPGLRAQVAVGQAVDLVDPALEVSLVPGSLDDPLDGLAHRAIVFKAMQVLR